MPARPSTDPCIGKTFSLPISKRDMAIKAEEIAKKQGVATSVSQLIVNLLTEFVERNESITSLNNGAAANKANNPLNIQYGEQQEIIKLFLQIPLDQFISDDRARSIVDETILEEQRHFAYANLRKIIQVLGLRMNGKAKPYAI
jgi:hypothetical protein